MKSLSALLLGAVLALPIAPAVHAQTTPSTATTPAVAEIIAQVRAAAPADRQKLIEAAVANNPAISANLAAALVTNFPTDAAALTKVVVDSVIGLGVSNTVKSELLAKIAQTAVQAALQIPQSSVPDLVATVNGVKDVLANVPADFKQAVAPYVIPVASIADIRNQVKDLINPNNNNTPIVSDDTLPPS